MTVKSKLCARRRGRMDKAARSLQAKRQLEYLRRRARERHKRAVPAKERAERLVYSRIYRKAMRRLVVAHSSEFDRYLKEEGLFNKEKPRAH